MWSDLCRMCPNQGQKMINEAVIKGKWKEIKGEIINQWGKMTDDELEKVSGNVTSIAGLIQQRYGEKKEVILERINSIATSFSEKTENIKNDMKKEQH